MKKKLSLKFPKKKILNLIISKKYLGNHLNMKVLNEFGFYVLKNALTKKLVEKYKNYYYENIKNQKIKKSDNHITQVIIKEKNKLNNIIKENKFIKIVKNFYEGNVGCDFIRIVRKDIYNKDLLFTHQDTGYQSGNTNDKYSLFIALTECNEFNGGINIFPGTHKYGYLGDVGEISKKITDKFLMLKTNLSDGDILFMNSNLWHNSYENSNLKDRIYLEVHIQNSFEPNTKYLVLGKSNNEWKISGDTKNLFTNSRTSRIKILNKHLSRLKKMINKSL